MRPPSTSPAKIARMFASYPRRREGEKWAKERGSLERAECRCAFDRARNAAEIFQILGLFRRAVERFCDMAARTGIKMWTRWDIYRMLLAFFGYGRVRGETAGQDLGENVKRSAGGLILCTRHYVSKLLSGRSVRRIHFYARLLRIELF